MADSKQSDLTDLTATTLATGDMVPVRDISNTSMAASGTNSEASVVDLVATGLGLIAMSPASGEYIGTQFGLTNVVTTTATTLNRMLFCPIFIPRTQTFDRIAMYLQTVGSAGAVGRAGIYRGATATGKPGPLVVDAGTIVTDATTGVRTWTISQSLTPGLYFVVFVSQTAVCTPRTITQVGGLATPVGSSAFQGTFTTVNQNLYLQASVSGALPDPAVPVYTENDQPAFVAMGLRAV